MSTLSNSQDALPTVNGTADRDARFPNPATDFKVYDKQSGYLQRWDGTAWRSEAALGRGADSIFDVTAFGAVGDGVTVSTSAIDAAIAAAVADGGGVVYLPAGTYVTAGGHVLSPGVRLEGAGSGATFLSHTGNTTCVALDCTDIGELFIPMGVSGLRITGTGGASARGIRVRQPYRAVLRDLFVMSYSGTDGVGLHFDNDTFWTEGTLLEQVHVRGCTTAMRFNRDTGEADTPSFAETRFQSCTIVQTLANSVGIDVPDTGTVIYGGHWGIKWNVEATGCTAIRVGAGARVYANTYSLYLETVQPLVAYPVLVSVGAGGEFWGHGQFAVDPNDGRCTYSVASTGVLWFGTQNDHQQIGDAGDALTRIARKTQSADGDVVIAYAASAIRGRFTLTFEGNNRQHTMVCEVAANQFDTSPVIAVVSDYAFGGNRVFGTPTITRLNDGTTPHFIVPVSNRNSGTDLRVRFDGVRANASAITLLPSAAAGTLGSTDGGTKVQVAADAAGLHVGAGRDCLIRRVGSNVLGTPWLAINGGSAISLHSTGSVTWDPGSVADGAFTSTTVTVPGADPTKLCLTLAQHSVALPDGCWLSTAITATDTVRVTLHNESGSSQDVASGTLLAGVFKYN